MEPVDDRADIRRFLAPERMRSAAPDEALQHLPHCGALSHDYLAFLRITDGYVAELEGDTAYVDLWPVDQVLELNEGYGPPRGSLMIGSDGGGTAFGIDVRSGDPAQARYMAFDWIVLELDEAEITAPSLCDLLEDFIRRLQEADAAGSAGLRPER